MGWQELDGDPERERIPFTHPTTPSIIWVNMDWDDIHFGDRFFLIHARMMLEGLLVKVAGFTRRSVIYDKMLEFRSALMRCREQRGWGMDDIGVTDG